MMSTFEFFNALYEKIYCGENCFSNALNQIVTKHQIKRVFFVSTNSLADTANYQQIKESMKSCLVGEFPKSQEHTPIQTVNEAVSSIKKSSIPDAIIAFGGSSVVDLAKSVAHKISANNPSSIISLPTTLSGAEYNSSFVTTDAGIKRPTQNLLTAPRWIILDPILTKNTPELLWASTGCKSLSDCIEVRCSKDGNSYTNQLAYNAIQLLSRFLLPSCQDPNNLEARQNCLLAPAFSMPAAINTSLGLITACRHQLGARFNIPHGLASAIMMPHILKWNFDYAMKQYADLSIALGLVNKPDKTEIRAKIFLQYIEGIIVKLNLNKKLREFVSNKNSLQEVVVPIMKSPFIHTNVRPVTCEQDVSDLLETAW